MTGQSRKNRRIDFGFDAETVGFYQSIGVEEVGRSLPYQPWDKAIERLFSTVCSKFSKWFDSYTGTLTGSKTYAKRKKDVDGMLERGELLTMEEFFEVWTKWKNEKYHIREHRGLKDAGEKWITPIELFEHGDRYEKAAPPREYAAMLLMKAATARVYNYGINKFGVVYADYELTRHIGETVGIKWDIDDVTKLYVYDKDGKKICEAVSAELLAFGEDKAARELLENALDDVVNLATVSVNAMEQTTAQAVRDKVKEGTANREELLELGRKVFREVKAAIAPEAQRVITQNLGSFDAYLTKCIEDAVLKVKRGDPYLTLPGELLEGVKEAQTPEPAPGQ